MTVSKDWDPTIPYATSNVTVATTGPTAIQDLKVAIHERMRNGGALWATASGASATDRAKEGRLSCGLIDTNVLRFYQTDGSTAFFEANDNTNTITLGDGTPATNAYAVMINGTTQFVGAQAPNTYFSTATSGTLNLVAGTERTIMVKSAATTVTSIKLPGATSGAVDGRTITVSYMNTTGAGTMYVRTAGTLDWFDNETDAIAATIVPSATNSARSLTVMAKTSGTTVAWYIMEKR